MKHQASRKSLFATALGVFALAAAPAYGASVAITNHSFESTNSGWTQVSGGIKTPPQDNLGPAPDGDDVYFTWTNGQNISQVLAATVAANTTYTLQMDYLTRTDGEGPITAFLALGYGAGGLGSGTELARIVNGDAGAPVPVTGSGSYTTWTLEFTTAASSPAGEGEVLWIGLGSNDTINNGSSGYDNVRLDATLVPEPSSAALLGLGALGVIRRRRRK